MYHTFNFTVIHYVVVDYSIKNRFVQGIWPLLHHIALCYKFSSLCFSFSQWRVGYFQLCWSLSHAELLTHHVFFLQLLQFSLSVTDFPFSLGVSLLRFVQLQTLLRVTLRQTGQLSLQGQRLSPAAASKRNKKIKKEMWKCRATHLLYAWETDSPY